MTDPSRIPPHPFGTRLTGRGAIALYHLGVDTPEARRRVTSLFREVPEGDRIPYFKDGGQPCSWTSWLDEYARKRCLNPVK